MPNLSAARDSLNRELKVYRQILRDPRTPRMARLLLRLAVGYTLLPVDLIPDFIPVLGQLDDLIVVPLLVLLSLRLIPVEVIDAARLEEALRDWHDYLR